MATWVSFKKARRFPNVINFFHKSGLFGKNVKTVGTSYARVPPGGAGVSRQNAQVDVSAITGVPALRRNGRKV